MSGRAGAGKTSIVANWLEQDPQRPQAWVRLSPEDEDPDWLLPRIAATILPKNCILPTMPIESDAVVASRRFLHELTQNLPPRAVLILDDHERLAVDSDIQRVLVTLAESWPADGKLIIVGRQEPPQAFARLQASRGFATIRDANLRLNENEAYVIAQQLLPDGSSEARIRSIVAAASGWIAGLVLLVRGASRAPIDLHSSEESQAVFDYFAEEIWQEFDSDTRQTLEIVSILPFVTEELSTRLVGRGDAIEPLRTLAASRFFVTGDSIRQNGETRFWLHPLFRTFLVQCLKRRLGSGAVGFMQADAADYLEQQGDANNALALYLEANRIPEAVTLIEHFAPAQYKAHRFRTLLRWMESLPEGLVENSGQLLLWQGASLALFDPLRSRALLCEAWPLLASLDEPELAILCCGVAIDTHMLMWGDFHGIDPWLERLLEVVHVVDAAGVDDRLTSSMVGALFFRRTGDTRIGPWIDHAISALNRRVEKHVLPMLAQWTFMATVWTRDMPAARVLLDAIHRQVAVDGKVATLDGVWLHSLEAIYQWNVGEPEAAVSAANAGLACADATGIRINDVLLHYSAGIASLMAGQIEAAEAHSVAAMEGTRTEALMNVVSHHQLAGMVAWHHGQHALARSHLAQGAELAKSAGLIFAEAYLYCGLAFMECEIGERGAGRAALCRAIDLVDGITIPFIEVDIALLKAWLDLDSEDRESRVAALCDAFLIARRSDRVATCWWRPALLSPVCAAALSEDIEPTHVSRIISTNGLSPPTWFRADERWPWPLRVRLCGELSIEINGTPLEFGNRVPARVLDLLTALFAREKRPGAGVNVNLLLDDLWPELEGDRGQDVFKTTLARLRRLLGIEGLLILSNGRLTFDPLRCWSDIGAIVAFDSEHASKILTDEQNYLRAEPFDALVGNASVETRRVGSIPDKSDQIDLAILVSYRGPPLDGRDDPWLEPLRRRVRRSVSGAAVRIANRYTALGKHDRAAAVRNRLIELDPTLTSVLGRDGTLV